MRNPRVAIVGAGMSGLLMGIKLAEAGFRDFEIYEKADAAGRDVARQPLPRPLLRHPVALLQLLLRATTRTGVASSRPGPEILRYFEGVADRYGLRPHLRLGTEIVSGRFEDGRWRVRTARRRAGELSTSSISACGVLHHPRMPDIEGLETFEGEELPLRAMGRRPGAGGKRVGLIGNGSTGVQIVAGIAGEVGHLTLFQRTPQWIMPLPNPRYTRSGAGWAPRGG